MDRRTMLRGTGTALGTALAGCLDTLPGSSDRGTVTTAELSGENPSHTAPTFQFQYDPQNSGVSASGVPDRIDARWRTTLSPNPVGLAVAGGRVLVANSSEVITLDAAGDQLWQLYVPPHPRAVPALSSDTAYVPTGLPSPEPKGNSGIVAIDLAEGRPRWRGVPEVDVVTAPTLAGGVLYASGVVDRTHVLAVDATTGS